jgi:hypothetical protein
MKTLLVLVASVLNWGLTFGVQWWDRRRLDGAQRARAWNVATWGAAIFWFGLLSMVPWFWVTRGDWGAWRRSKDGVPLIRAAWVLLKGVGAAVVLLVAMSLATEVFARVLGVDPD